MRLASLCVGVPGWTSSVGRGIAELPFMAFGVPLMVPIAPDAVDIVDAVFRTL